MTAYNREAFIAEAIESVLASSFKDFELIIVDDRSTDNTVALARNYEALDSRVKVYVNEENLKDYPNRNRAASYAKGEYLKYLDSDDTIYPWGLEAMVRCMDAFPDAGFGLMSKNMATEKSYPLCFNGDQAYRIFFFQCALLTMGPSGSIIKRKVFEEAGGFSGKPYIGDLEMWLKLLKKHDVVAMPEDLIWWRQHEGQQYREGHDNSFYEQNTFNLYKQMLTAPDCPMPAKDAAIALQNQYNIRSRRVVREFLKGNVSRSLQLYRLHALTPADILKSRKKNPVLL